jgi:hypothetical protein
MEVGEPGKPRVYNFLVHKLRPLPFQQIFSRVTPVVGVLTGPLNTRHQGVKILVSTNRKRPHGTGTKTPSIFQVKYSVLYQHRLMKEPFERFHLISPEQGVNCVSLPCR